MCYKITLHLHNDGRPMMTMTNQPATTLYNTLSSTSSSTAIVFYIFLFSFILCHIVMDVYLNAWNVN